MCLPEYTRKLENELSQYTVEIVKNKCKYSWLFWLAPTCYRDAEGEIFWHPYSDKKIYKILLFLRLITSVIKGINKFINSKYGSVTFYNNESKSFGLIPKLLTRRKYYSSYIDDKQANSLDWIVFNQNKKRTISLVDKYYLLTICFRLILDIIVAVVKLSNISFNSKYVATLLNLEWILSLRWVHYYYLDIDIRKIFISKHYEIVFCVHEMHPHARILWRISNQYECKSITMQHASIHRNRLWLFYMRNELSVSPPLPKVFCVYSNMIKNEIVKYYNDDVDIVVASSLRFNYLRDLYVQNELRSDVVKKITLVSSVSWMDIEVVLRIMEKVKFINSILREGIKIVYRPHPTAKPTFGQKKRIKRLLRNKIINLDKDELVDSIHCSDLVMGCNTFTLLEANIAGTPSLSVNIKQDFVYFPFPYVKVVDLNDLELDTVISTVREFNKDVRDSTYNYLCSSKDGLNITY